MKLCRLVSILAVTIPALAAAHVGIPSGPAIANKTGQKITFGISHGCDGIDTLSIKIDIPAGVDATTVKPMPSDFDPTPEVMKSGTAVTYVKWEKSPADLQLTDNTYYELTLRMKVTDVPFTRIPFTITQVCRPQGGSAADDVTVVWTGTAEPEPAPRLVVVPAHVDGWNKLTLSTAVAAADLGVYFGDAQIVWRGTEAFSNNMAIMAVIGMTPGVTALSTDLAAGDEIWVKY
jgi:uncharacterized protein YcnI